MHLRNAILAALIVIAVYGLALWIFGVGPDRESDTNDSFGED